MSIEADLYTYLQTSSSLTSAIGVKLTPDHASQKSKLPYVIYERVSTDSPVHLGGATSRENTRVSFDCYATTRSSANSIADLIRDRLHGKRGTVGTTTVDVIVIDNQFSDSIPPQDGSAQESHIASLMANVWHAVAISNP